MELTREFIIRKALNSRRDTVDFANLEFGKVVSDHMLVCDYYNGEWQTPAIQPFASFSLSPAAQVLHYGQSVFEGLKAFKMADGAINIFRIDKHYSRFVRSLERMCMAIVPEELFADGIVKLVEMDRDWVPGNGGDSLYIRPFAFATETKFGVKSSEEYRFIIFTGPVPEIFSHPVKLKVETEYSRAARGGTGFAKCGGNYGGAHYAAKNAREKGYDQVIWTDARDHTYIEEAGMMNIMFVINDTLVTPPLSDSILDGITRDSLLTIARDLGIKTEVRPVNIEELKEAFYKREIRNAFGVGTAALIAPIAVIGIGDVDFYLPQEDSNSIPSLLKQNLSRIQKGLDPDIHQWNFVV